MVTTKATGANMKTIGRPWLLRVWAIIAVSLLLFMYKYGMICDWGKDSVGYVDKCGYVYDTQNNVYIYKDGSSRRLMSKRFMGMYNNWNVCDGVLYYTEGGKLKSIDIVTGKVKLLYSYTELDQCTLRIYSIDDECVYVEILTSIDAMGYNNRILCVGRNSGSIIESDVKTLAELREYRVANNVFQIRKEMHDGDNIVNLYLNGTIYLSGMTYNNYNMMECSGYILITMTNKKGEPSQIALLALSNGDIQTIINRNYLTGAEGYLIYTDRFNGKMNDNICIYMISSKKTTILAENNNIDYAVISNDEMYTLSNSTRRGYVWKITYSDDGIPLSIERKGTLR